MHVVVTGSSRGIGRELKTRLTERGDRVTGTSRDHSSGTRLDVSDPGQQARFAAQIKGDPVDLLICNAGVYLDKSMALKDYTAEVWAKSLAVNVTGVFLTVQAMLPNLKLAETPKIAIISSQMASHARAPGGILCLPRLKSRRAQYRAQPCNRPQTRRYRGWDLSSRLGAHRYGGAGRRYLRAGMRLGADQ